MFSPDPFRPPRRRWKEEAGSLEPVSAPSLIASSLLFAAVFGSIGLTVEAALSRAT